jgi:hypothetical protein
VRVALRDSQGMGYVDSAQPPTGAQEGLNVYCVSFPGPAIGCDPGSMILKIHPILSITPRRTCHCLADRKWFEMHV